MTDLLAAQKADFGDLVKAPEQRIVVASSAALLSLATEGNRHRKYATPEIACLVEGRRWIDVVSACG